MGGGFLAKFRPFSWPLGRANAIRMAFAAFSSEKHGKAIKIIPGGSQNGPGGSQNGPGTSPNQEKVWTSVFFFVGKNNADCVFCCPRKICFCSFWSPLGGFCVPQNAPNVSERLPRERLQTEMVKNCKKCTACTREHRFQPRKAPIFPPFSAPKVPNNSKKRYRKAVPTKWVSRNFATIGPQFR